MMTGDYSYFHHNMQLVSDGVKHLFKQHRGHAVSISRSVIDY